MINIDDFLKGLSHQFSGGLKVVKLNMPDVWDALKDCYFIFRLIISNRLKVNFHIGVAKLSL
jgi:hypothetical protein